MKRHYYFKERFLGIIGILIFSAVTAYGAEESITLTTYYPSPYGVYSEMRLYPKDSPTTCSGTQRGLMYYDDSENRLKVCNGTPPYQDIGGGYWAASPSNSANIYNTNLGNVGIGTNNPTGYGPGKSLHLFDPSNTNSGIRMQAGSTDVGIGTAAGLNGMILGAISNGPIQFLTNSSEMMRIAANGDVGIGTSNPSEKLHVNGSLYVGSNWIKAGNLIAVNNAISAWAGGGGVASGFSNGRAVTMGQTTSGYSGFGISSGTTPVASFYAGPTNNEVGIASYAGGPDVIRMFKESPGGGSAADIMLVRDGTIHLRNQNGIDRLFVASSGSVGIGTTNPGARLHVAGTMGCQFPGVGPWGGDLFLVSQEGNRPVARIRDDNGAENPVLQFAKGTSWMNLEYYGSYLGIYGNMSNTVRISNIAVGGAFPGYFASWPYETIGMHPTNNLRINFGSTEKYVFNNNGWAVAAAGGGWTTSSDQQFKENVVELTDVMRALKNIRGVRFSWKTKDFPQKGFPEGTQVGFIAQEIEQEFPELVATDSQGYKSLDYGKLTPVLLEAVKEQQAKIESLEARIETLEKR